MRHCLRLFFCFFFLLLMHHFRPKFRLAPRSLISPFKCISRSAVNLGIITKRIFINKVVIGWNKLPSREWGQLPLKRIRCQECEIRLHLRCKGMSFLFFRVPPTITFTFIFIVNVFVGCKEFSLIFLTRSFLS